MKLLLDTHAFLWFIQGNDDLSPFARSSIENPANQKFISTASLWEITIKVSIGRLDVGMSMIELANREVIGNAFGILSIEPSHLEELEKLPFHHKDPFDRLIIAQSLAESIPVISKDRVFQSYSVQIVW